MYKNEIIRATVGIAVRSLYQMIMVVNGEDHSCHVVDYNSELRNISEDINSFDTFCKDLYINVHPEDRGEFAHFVDPEYALEQLANKVYISYRCRIRQVNNQYYWYEIVICNATEVDSTEGNSYLFLLRDIHEWKTEELKQDAEQRAIIKSMQNRYDELFEENMKDSVTGCYNRKGLKFYEDLILDEVIKTDSNVFICVADLNGLKYLNDNFGHKAGDDALAAVSAEFLKNAPQGAKVFRTGGDEFLIMAALPADSTEPSEMCRKIDEGISEYNATHSNDFEIGVSYGWVLLPMKEGMTDFDEYIMIADDKMYEMKKQRDVHRRE